MPESAAKQRMAGRAGGVGGFNVAGRSADGGDVEFYRRGGKIFVRGRSQTTKDRATMRAKGEDPNSTKRDKVSTSAKITAKAEAKTEGKLLGTDKPATLAEGAAGSLEGEYTVGGASASASAEASLSADGVEVKTGAGVKVTLVGGKLVYKLPELPFDILGEQLKLEAGTELSAEVAAEAKGEVGLQASKEGDGVHIGSSAGAEAFAGAKAGFKIFGKLSWNDPKSSKWEDVVGASAGVEGFAGAAAAAKISCSLAPSIKANAYWGAAVGLGAAVKFSVEINAIKAARLAYILAARGLKAAWDGLQRFGKEVATWLRNGAASVINVAGEFLDDVSEWLTHSKSIDAVNQGLHRHMTPYDRGRLIKQLLVRATFNTEEDAIIKVLTFSKMHNDIYKVVRTVGNGSYGEGRDDILWDLDGTQDTQARRLL